MKKKYIAPNGAISGYITGIQLANMYGFITQNGEFLFIYVLFVGMMKYSEKHIDKKVEEMDEEDEK